MIRKTAGVVDVYQRLASSFTWARITVTVLGLHALSRLMGLLRQTDTVIPGFTFSPREISAMLSIETFRSARPTRFRQCD